MDELIELFRQIEELAGMGADALEQAAGAEAGGAPEGPPPGDEGLPPEEAGGPPPGDEELPPEEEPF